MILVGYVIWCVLDGLNGDARRISFYWCSGWAIATVFIASGVAAEGVALALASACAASLLAALTSLAW